MRRSCKVYGAVSVNGTAPKFHFRFEEDKFNAYSFVTFLEGVIRYYKKRGQKVHMVVDGAKYHRTALLWIANNAADDIELHFLPAYSPNLNLIERLGKFVRKQCLYSHYYADFPSFKTAISTCLNQASTTHKAALDSLLTLRFQRFKKVHFVPV